MALVRASDDAGTKPLFGKGVVTPCVPRGRSRFGRPAGTAKREAAIAIDLHCRRHHGRHVVAGAVSAGPRRDSANGTLRSNHMGIVGLGMEDAGAAQCAYDQLRSSINKARLKVVELLRETVRDRGSRGRSCKRKFFEEGRSPPGDRDGRQGSSRRWTRACADSNGGGSCTGTPNTGCGSRTESTD